MARLIDRIIGHERVWQALEEMRRAEHLPHSLVFAGPSGIGKRLMGWALAQALLCEREGQIPCGDCAACHRVETRSSEGVLAIEPQGAFIKIEAAHQALEFLGLRRITRARVVIVDQAQMLNAQAANALLKMVEEPPPSTYFIFVVNEVSQLLPTLRSRTQVLKFAPLSTEQIARGEKWPDWMLRAARGSFEQLENLRDSDVEEIRQLTLGFVKESFEGSRSGVEAVLDRAKDRGDALMVVRFLQQILRDWSMLDAGDMIHADAGPLLRGLPPWEARQRVEMWRAAFQMENDLSANVDRALVFENFYYRARGQR